MNFLRAIYIQTCKENKNFKSFLVRGVSWIKNWAWQFHLFLPFFPIITLDSHWMPIIIMMINLHHSKSHHLIKEPRVFVIFFLLAFPSKFYSSFARASQSMLTIALHNNIIGCNWRQKKREKKKTTTSKQAIRSITLCFVDGVQEPLASLANNHIQDMDNRRKGKKIIIIIWSSSMTQDMIRAQVLRNQSVW